MLKPAENIAVSFGLFMLVLFTTGCNSGKYLGPGQTFLEENSVTIKSSAKTADKAVLRSELEKLYAQKATRTFIGIPRHVFYYEAEKKPGDSTGIQRILRKWGDDPVITDSSLIFSTEENFKLHLRQRGYWDNEVSYTVTVNGNRSRVLYRVDPMQRWTVSSLKYVCEDSTVQVILDSLLSDSYLAPGAPVDVDLYEQEKVRITRALQNRGYAYFFQNYVTEPIADSSDHRMDLEIRVTTPADADRHTKYTIGSIVVYPEVNAVDSVGRDSVINGVTFLDCCWPKVRPEIISRNVYLEIGRLYQRDAYDKTLRQLGRLETYKFVSLRPEIDPQDSTLINYQLLLVRNKKMGVGGDIEFNYASLADRALFGIGGNLNFRHRNFFKGAELFTTNAEAGVELNLNQGSRIYSANIQVQHSLLIPKFIDPFGFYHLLHRIPIGNGGIIGDKTFNWLQEGSTNVSAGYQFLSLFNLYDYHSLTARLGYDAQPDAQRRLQLNHLGIDYFNPFIKAGFKEILEGNVFLRESFRKQLFTGLLFRDYRYEYQGHPRLHKTHFAIIHGAEVSGLEILGLNSLTNALTGKHSAYELGSTDPLSFSQFAKFEIDTRLYHSLASNQSLAFRFDVGVAFPYGPFSSQVPYIKQFYVGGPASVRAWQIRELGPGGYQDLMVNPDLPFYQTGDFKVEMSLEYRFDLVWVFKGALFLDAGNVWTIQNDPNRPKAVLSGDFVNQMAVGTGLGVRMKFPYFLIRLDFGYKLRNPYPNESGKYWLFDNFKEFSFKQFTTNFAIGYPF